MKTLQLLRFIVASAAFTIVSCTPQVNPISTKGSNATRIQGLQRDLSSYEISSFAMDAKDLLWVGTDKNVFSFDGQYSRIFSTSTNDFGFPATKTLCIFNDRSLNVWIGTDKGLCSYTRYNRFKQYLCGGQSLNDVSQILETSDGVLIIKAESGYYSMNTDQTLKYMSTLSQGSSRSVAVADDNGGLWINSDEASIHFDRFFNPIDSIATPSVKTPTNLCAIKVGDTMWALQSHTLSCIKLNDGTVTLQKDVALDDIGFIFQEDSYILLKSASEGILTFDTQTLQFESPELAYIPVKPSRNDISCMYHDPLGNLWIGYQHFGIKCIGKDDKELSKLNDVPLHNLTTGQYIYSLDTDNRGSIWGCTDSKLFCSDISGDNVNIFETQSAQHIRKLKADGDYLWLLRDKTLTLASPINGNIKVVKNWPVGNLGDMLAHAGKCYSASDNNQLLIFDNSGKCDSLDVNYPFFGKNSKFLETSSGDILLIGEGFKCLRFNPGTRMLSEFNIQREGQEPKSIDIAIDAEIIGDKAYIASNNRGIFSLDLISGKLIEISALSAFHVSSILGYSDQLLIMGTENGIVYYDLGDDSVRVLNPFLGEENPSSYSPGSIVKGRGCVLMGCNDGCVVVPASISKVAENHHISVHGVFLRDEEGVRTVYLPEDESLCVLKSHNNSFEISFGGIVYDNQPTSTQYMLDGYNPYWIETKSRNTITFSKIPAGHYVFRLRELMPFTDTVINEKDMKVIVKKAPWETPWAFGLYFLLALSLAYLAKIVIDRRKSDEQRLSLSEQKRELEHRTNQMNMTFFANIAHEFRNPLTIVSAPLASLLADNSLSESVHKKIVAISASANTMLRLIDQMLDFNQLEMDVLKVRVGEHDVSYELSKLVDIFEESAGPRDITVECSGLEEPFISLVDMDKFEKIINNLFTNALKHTPAGGTIKISFDDITLTEAQEEFSEAELTSSRYFSISVANNGKPIPEEKLDNIFKRYYQSTDSATHNFGWGRGIGLYYVKRLVDIQHGAIRVFNIPDGVCFKYIIPTDKELFADAENEDSRVHQILQIELPREDKTVKKAAEYSSELMPTILIVDDDIQIGQYLRSIFEDKYKTINKYSAEAAMESLNDISPDIIISDVVMDKMSGIEFCRTLKHDLTYSHIPIILLTAKTDVEDSVYGLESGANAYVTKPFSAEYLQALVSSLLKNVENIRSSLNANTEVSMVDGSLSEQDRNFINELYQLMDKHLSEADLSVSTICDELKISRSKFNYKLKGLTGSTPGSFFRHYKLNLAAKLIKEGKYNISEISDMMGFASISNFSASFKKLFGVAPRDYR